MAKLSHAIVSAANLNKIITILTFVTFAMIKWKTFQMSTSVFATTDQIDKAITCVICVSVVTFVTFAMIKQTKKQTTDQVAKAVHVLVTVPSALDTLKITLDANHCQSLLEHIVL